jgi:hypothetical protein
MKASVLIEPHYFPSLEYFSAIQGFDKLILEKQEHYIKQSYRNRCYINTAHGVDTLVVPVTGRHGKILFKDIRIDPGKRWRNNQWRTLQSAYAKAPFFEHYSDELNSVLYTGFEFLFDLNKAVLSLCLQSLSMKKDISETVSYEKQVSGDVFDLRSQINLKRSYTARSFYHPQTYHQVFGNSFAGNLSLIDLLFCEGPNALANLKASGKKDLNK